MKIETEAVEVCPYCMGESVFRNYDVEKDGYTVKCQHCGEKIMLCDECMHSDDNPHGNCDWHEIDNGGTCFRGTTVRRTYD